MDADISVLQDVCIEHAEDNAITVLSDVPGIRGEELTMRIGLSDGVPMTLQVRTTSSEPRMLDGRLVHRVHLTIMGAAAEAGTEGLANVWRSADHTSIVVVRRHSARVLNLSRGGCLFELSNRLPVGTVATLQRDDPHSSHEPVRINSLHERKGVPWPYAVGAEFLSLEPPSSHSLRALAGRMEADEDR